MLHVPQPELIARYDKPTPRYTSYPTAVKFSNAITPSHVHGWLAELPSDKPVSLYIHLPFCKSLCLYCGCNMKVTHHNAPKNAYMKALLAEIQRAARYLGTRLKVSTLHLGGGTPTYMQPETLEQLLTTLHNHFDILPEAEYSVEIDPRTLSDDMVKTLAKLGFNRASLGVQDTDPTVQQAINRIQPLDMTRSAVTRLRAAGIQHINIDLIYGLPEQTEVSIARTVADVIPLAPDRLAMYGYAHVPWMKKHQTVLEQYHLPTPLERAGLLTRASNALVAAGYAMVGIDHFAKPTDPLVQALHTHTLTRNFMGYTTDSATTLLGFGASGISSLPQGFSQNTPDIPAYQTALAEGRLPVIKGYAYQGNDTTVQTIIHTLMCYLEVEDALIPPTLAAMANPRLTALGADGLVERTANGWKIPPSAHPFARVVAACFDEYLPTSTDQQAHAKAI